jgi:hypothetical protein
LRALSDAVGAAALSVGGWGLFGVGIASADTSARPDVVGMMYSDAVPKIQDGGGTAKITVTVGDRQSSMGARRLPTRQQCGVAVPDRGVASATTPGASLGSLEGRAFDEKAEAAARKQQSQ